MKGGFDRWIHVVVVLVLLITLAANPSMAQQGLPAELKALADKGDPDGLFMLGLFYDVGADVRKDPTEAARLFQKAVDAGHVPSKTQLGLMYQTGTGVPRNLVKARTLFEEAAKAGDAEAQFRLGMASVYGIGVAKDAVTARRWFTSAANAGHPEAQLMLGIMLEAGTGGPKNDFAARRFLRSAASGKDPDVAKRAKELAGKIDERVLFSGPFRPAEAAVIAAISAGLAAMMLGGSDSDIQDNPRDPSNPSNYLGMGTNKRKEHCITVTKRTFQPTFKLNPLTTYQQCTSY